MWQFVAGSVARRIGDRVTDATAAGTGVERVRLSPYAPPQLDRFDTLNAVMLQRTGEREAARELWAIGTPYREQPVATVTVRTRHPLGLPSRAAAPLMPRPRSRRWWTAIAAVAVLIAVAALAATAGAAAGWAMALALVG